MHILSQELCAPWPLALFAVERDNVRMSHTDRPPHYLRQWRKHLGIALEQVRELAEALLADRVVAEGEEPDLGKIGLSHSTLSRIETFKLPYNQALLELLAEIYGTDPASLIMRNPADPDGIWSIYDQIPEAARPTALRVLSGFKTGTDG
jgi:transcriptional regulator with XRE-family HTH domain